LAASSSSASVKVQSDNPFWLTNSDKKFIFVGFMCVRVRVSAMIKGNNK
jgi:hypothetical protein